MNGEPAAAPVLIWTRAAADWPRDESYLSITSDVLRIPCLCVADLPRPLAGVREPVLVVTSPRGVEHLARELALRPGPWPEIVHAFGGETGRRLAALAQTIPAGDRMALRQHEGVRTAEALAPLLAAEIAPDSAVAVLGPEVPAYDLAGFLAQNGRRVRHVACYRTEARATDANGTALGAAAAAAMAKTWRGVVCFASPTAVAGFVAAFPPDDGGLRSRLVAVALGPSTAAAATPYFDRVDVSPQNELTSLIKTATASRNAHFSRR